MPASGVASPVVLEIWGWACAVVGAVFSVPQVLRLLRSGTSAGLSLRAWQLNTAVALGWTLHGIRAGYWNMFASNAVIAVLSLLTIAMIRRDRALSLRTAWLLPAAATGVLFGMEYLTTPLLLGVVVLLPQLFAQGSQSAELIREPDLSGVSTTFIALNALLPAMWFVWGLGAGDASVLLTAGAMTLITAFNLGWLLARNLRLVAPRTAHA